MRWGTGEIVCTLACSRTRSAEGTQILKSNIVAGVLELLLAAYFDRAPCKWNGEIDAFEAQYLK